MSLHGSPIIYYHGWSMSGALYLFKEEIRKKKENLELANK